MVPGTLLPESEPDRSGGGREPLKERDQMSNLTQQVLGALPGGRRGGARSDKLGHWQTGSYPPLACRPG